MLITSHTYVHWEHFSNEHRLISHTPYSEPIDSEKYIILSKGDIMEDKQLMEWVSCNLSITHVQLTKDEATLWINITTASDPTGFATFALFGYALKKAQNSAGCIPGDEIALFLVEFSFKIIMAAAGLGLNLPGLPLFERVGLTPLAQNYQAEIDRFCADNEVLS